MARYTSMYIGWGKPKILYIYDSYVYKLESPKEFPPKKVYYRQGSETLSGVHIQIRAGAIYIFVYGCTCAIIVAYAM